MSEDPERTDGLGPAREPEPADAPGPPSGWRRIRDLMGDQPSLAIVVLLLAAGALALAIFGLVRLLGVDSASERAAGDGSGSGTSVEVGELVTGDSSEVTRSNDAAAEEAAGAAGDPADEGSDAADDERTGDGGPQDGVADGEAAPLDAGLVAYRLEGTVHVAGVDGSEPRAVTPLSDGTYALSPDGTTLAVVDNAARRVKVVNVATGAETVVSVAYAQTPVWSADSGWFVYTVRTAEGYEVWSASRDGIEPEKIAAGHSGRTSSDPTVAGFVSGGAPGSAGQLTRVVRGETPQPVQSADDVAEFGFADGGYYYVCAGPDCPLTAIRYLPAQGGEAVDVVGPPAEGGKPGRYAALSVSPDGDWLAYTLAGDDGYSRLWVVRVDGTDARELSVRRDAYPVRWTPDSEYLLFIEGNAIHGEETRLMRVRPDGTGRMELVANAGL
jgi:hypothetical protein